MSEYTIEFNNVWKKFSRGHKRHRLSSTLSSMAQSFLKPAQSGQPAAESNGLETENDFWALKDVSFQMKKGEVLGIIGPNGAGKSTILKILSEISAPTKGSYSTKGRLSAIIEVTAGFHPDFTGRENVYFNGAILGMTKQEIDEKYDTIVNFSGIRNFMDTPVKYYSSGMGARLGFSLAAHVNPDILLVDEVLSVGDMAFKAKCEGKMRELLNSGKTIIIISHNVALIQNLCQRVILLNKGEVVQQGPSKEVIPYYESLMNEYQEANLKKIVSHSEKTQEKSADTLRVTIPAVRVCDKDGNQKEVFSPSEEITLEIDYESNSKAKSPVFTAQILRQDNIVCCYFNSKDAGFEVADVMGKGTIQVNLGRTNLTQGVYVMKVSIWDSKQMHPYVVVKKGIFKIETNLRLEYGESVFLLDAQWSKKQ